MELALDRPGGAPVQVYRCRQCGDLRSCRPGWHTRCHICLDERSNDQQLNENSQDCLATFAADPLLGLRVGRNLNLDHGQQINGRAIVQPPPP